MNDKNHSDLIVTIIVDDAGSGDLLFGVVIGAYREETQEFKYDIIATRFFQPDFFKQKGYLTESSRIVSRLISCLKLKPEETVSLCQGYIFDEAAEELKKAYGEERICRIRVVGEAQRLTEIAYLDEIRNLGYEPLDEREEKRGKSFFHMMQWLKKNPQMLSYAKTGWPRLARYKMFKKFHPTKNNGHNGDHEGMFKVVCAECGDNCEVPFKPHRNRPVYCPECWATRKPILNKSA